MSDNFCWWAGGWVRYLGVWSMGVLQESKRPNKFSWFSFMTFFSILPIMYWKVSIWLYRCDRNWVGGCAVKRGKCCKFLSHYWNNSQGHNVNKFLKSYQRDLQGYLWRNLLSYLQVNPSLKATLKSIQDQLIIYLNIF